MNGMLKIKNLNSIEVCTLKFDFFNNLKLNFDTIVSILNM